MSKVFMTIGFWELAEIPRRTWTSYKSLGVGLSYPYYDLKE